jgi:uncharacterized protein YutE (UPF0331/DUF86 family)
VIDVDLVHSKLAYIEDTVTRVRRTVDPARIESDEMMRYYTERLLQLAAQATLDVAWHVLADQKLGQARDNKNLFEILGREDWLPRDLAARLGEMASFRNILVHNYTEIDLKKVRAIVENDLGDLEEFAAIVRGRVTGAE